MERYVRQVLDSIVCADEDKERLEVDLRAHFEEGRAAGDADPVIVQRMGPPEDVAASFMETMEPHYAGFWIRVVAFCADLGAIATVTLPLFCGVFVLMPAAEDSDPGPIFLLLLLPIVLFTIGVWVFYFPVLEHRAGKTLGKHLLGLRVQTEARTRIGLGRAFLRRLSFFFEFLVLDALFVPFTAKKQRAFDLVARTVVLRERVPVGATGWALAVALIAIPLVVVVAVGFVSAWASLSVS